MRTSTGFSTEAVYIFNNMLRKLSKQYDPPFIAAIFESGEATHRVQEFAEYKANRTETPPDLLDQIPYREIARDPVVLPARVRNPDYHRGPIPPEMFVPARY